MFFYLSLIIITCLLFNCASNIENKSYRLFFCIISIIPASIIAGFRDLNIGQDLMGYGILFFERAKHANSFTLLFDIESKEYGYHALNYICSRVSDDIHFLLFTIEFLKLLLVVLSILHLKKYIKNGSLILITYMLFMYCEGLSLIRQSIALAICLLSLTFFFDKEYFKYAITVAIAYLFHNSAIFFFILPFMTILYKKLKHPMSITILIIIVTYISATSLFLFIAGSGLFNDSLVDRYLDSGVTTAKTNILIIFWIFLSTCLFQKKAKCNKEYLYLIKANSLFALLFLFLSSYFEVAFRISYYQLYILMVLYLYFIDQIKNKEYRFLCSIIYIFLFLLHFIISAKNEMFGTIPYNSKILGL